MVPRDERGAAMSGLLTLEVTGPDFLQLSVRPHEVPKTPNAVEIRARDGAVLGEQAEIVVRERDTGHSFTFALPTADADAEARCGR